MTLTFAIQTALFVQFGLACLLFLWQVSVCWRLYGEHRQAKERTGRPDGITLGLLLVFGGWALLTGWWVWTIPLVSMRFGMNTADRLANLLVYDLFLALTLGAAAKLDYHLFRSDE